MTTTIYANVLTKSNSSLDLTTRFYCPFCTSHFALEQQLKDHTKSLHAKDLKIVTKQSNRRTVEFYHCPFCLAKFYLKELLPKHILRRHENLFVNILNGSTENYFQCLFCNHKVLCKHYKLLILHIENKHNEEFGLYILQKYSKIGLSCEDLIKLDGDLKLTNTILTPGLSDEMKQLTTYDADEIIYVRSPLVIKPILKEITHYCSQENTDNDDNYNENCKSLSAKRKLRFELPEKSPEANFENINIKLNSVFGKKQKNGFFKKFKKNKNIRVVNHPDDDGVIPLKLSPSPLKKIKNSPRKNDSRKFSYKCGLCRAGFNENCLLRSHLKEKHVGIQLRPQYRCGECNAKFYINKHFVKHRLRNHKPLCLRSIVDHSF